VVTYLSYQLIVQCKLGHRTASTTIQHNLPLQVLSISSSSSLSSNHSNLSLLQLGSYCLLFFGNICGVCAHKVAVTKDIIYPPCCWPEFWCTNPRCWEGCRLPCVWFCPLICYDNRCRMRGPLWQHKHNM